MTATEAIGPQTSGLRDKPVEHLIRKFFGYLERWPIEPDGINFTQADIRRICEHISATGHCLWHAQAVVMRKPCNCAKCRP